MEYTCTLTAGVAHDCNNMLYVILGSLELAERAACTECPIEPHIQRVQHAAQHSRDLIAQLLSASRYDSLAFQPVQFDDLVGDTVDLLRALVPPRFINCQVGPDCGRVMGDPTRLEQVIINLVLNASQAMKDRPGSISVTTRRVDIECAPAKNDRDPGVGGHVELAVADTGPGIPRAVLSRIMEPLFTTKPDGLGLGLPVAHRIVAAHGGTLTISSEMGHGTVATVRLPRLSAEGPDASTGNDGG